MNQEQFVENAGTSKTLYRGLGRFEPIAVNPDAEGIRKIYGMSPDKDVKEPNYENGDSYRIDIYLKQATAIDPMITKVAFFIQDEEVVTKDGSKKLYTNHRFQSFYFPTEGFKEAFDAYNDAKNEDWQKFSEEGLRVAKKGEVELLGFIIALYNLSTAKNKLEFENFKRMTNGNLAELKELLKNASEREREIYALVGVKDEKYQDVFNKMFLPVGYSSKQEKRLYDQAKYSLEGKVDFIEGKMEIYQQATPPKDSVEEEDDNVFTNGSITQEQTDAVKAMW